MHVTACCGARPPPFPPYDLPIQTKERGGVLNYDELVVYDDAAAKPTHLISYSFEA